MAADVALVLRLLEASLPHSIVINRETELHAIQQELRELRTLVSTGFRATHQKISAAATDVVRILIEHADNDTSRVYPSVYLFGPPKTRKGFNLLSLTTKTNLYCLCELQASLDGSNKFTALWHPVRTSDENLFCRPVKECTKLARKIGGALKVCLRVVYLAMSPNKCSVYLVLTLPCRWERDVDIIISLLLFYYYVMSIFCFH